MKYLKTFKELINYNEYLESDDFITPNVSYINDDNIVKYNPLPYFIMCTYSYHYAMGQSIDLYNNGDNFLYMIVDGIKKPLSKSYTFNGSGNHNVMFALKDDSIIEDNTFQGIYDLVNVIIPLSVQTIGKNAFNSCNSLESINIPDSVTTIGDVAFIGCEVLDNIILPNSLTIINRQVFQACDNLKNIIIPNSVTTIEGSAFLDCTSLESINIPNSVTTIGKSAFENCTSLVNINLSNGVERIGYQSFCGCSSLESINLPLSIRSIDDLAFENCIKLKEIICNSLSDALSTPTIGSYKPFLNVCSNGVLKVPAGSDYTLIYNEGYNGPEEDSLAAQGWTVEFI